MPLDVRRRVQFDLALFAGAAALSTAVFLVVARSTGLWLDEAQSVAIARLPVTGLLHALRQDGSPPLYYLLLHAWIRLFGTGDTAVRALSALFAVGAAPAAYLAGRRTLGRRSGRVAAALLVTMPFFNRYATEARMYSLVVLLAALAWLVGERAWRAPTALRLAGVAAVTGALALTHYWAFFLIVPAAGAAAWRRRWDLLGAMAAGGLVFVPWLPSFAYQTAHTGAPWGPTATTSTFEFALRGFAGGGSQIGLLGFVFIALALLAVFGHVAGDDVRVDLRGSIVGVRLAAAVLVPLALGLAISAATGAAFAVRYAAIVVVPFAFLLARGVELLRPTAVVRTAVAGIVVLGLVQSAADVHGQRSQARSIAAVLNTQAKENDLVVFCPDQLGPAVTRLLHTGAATSAYPTATPGDIINWVDYADRNHAAEPVPFADNASAGTAGNVWLVTANGYRTFGSSCGRIYTELARLRPGLERLVRSRRSSYEHASLWRFPPR